ncbi:MAG: InlB B-repeat-containing protein, partial [Synergistales bacterium]|nr:InlB B-repeat-containing protein [Synergistales bacterium]
MKRIKCFMLLCAFVLALTGSAWADDFTVSADLLSFDEAVNAAISFDISGDKKIISDDSRDVVFMVKLSIDAVASIDSTLDKITVIKSGDTAKTPLETFKVNQSIDVFVVGSGDVRQLDAFKLSSDSGNKSHDLLVAFPVVLFEKASGDMSFTSSDNSKKVKDLTIHQNYSFNVSIDNIAVSSDVVQLAYLSSDKTYKTWTNSSDFPAITSTFVIVTSGDVTASKDFVEFAFSSDVFGMGDLVITKFVTSNDSARNVAYGIIYSGDISADVISTDKIWINPMPILSDEAEVKITVYNASDDAISPTVTFKRYVMTADSFDVSFDLDGGTYSGDVKLKQTVEFASPDTWLITEPASSDLAKSGYTFLRWADSDDQTSFDFTKIPTKAMTIVAVWSADEEEQQQTSGGSFDFKVTVTANPESVSVDKTFKLTATVTSIDLDKVTTEYKWTWKNATTTTAQPLSLDKDSGDVTATSAMYPSADFYVTVTITSGDTVSHDAHTTVKILSGDSGTPGGETSGDTGKVLSTLAVTISPDKGTYDVSVNKADTIDLSLTVKATYSGDTTATDVTSTLGAKATWTLGTVSPTTTVFSLKNDSGATNTLNIASAITEGTYTVPVSVKVTSGDVSDDATVTYTIVASKSGGSGGGTPDSGDVTSGDVTSGDVTKEDAKEAVTEALKGKTNPSVTDLLGST